VILENFLPFAGHQSLDFPLEFSQAFPAKAAPLSAATLRLALC